MLASRRAAGAGVSMAAVLFGVFAVSMVPRRFRDAKIPCGCFGSTTSEPVSLATIARSLVLATMSAVGLVLAIQHPGSVGSLSTLLAVLTSVYMAMILRFISLLPLVWDFWTNPSDFAPTVSRRVSVADIAGRDLPGLSSPSLDVTLLPAQNRRVSHAAEGAGL